MPQENWEIETRKTFPDIEKEHLTPWQKEAYDTTNPQLIHTLTTEQQNILREIEKAQTVEKRVIKFAKILDLCLLEPAISALFPIAWDRTIATISTLYLLAEWIRIWLSRQDCAKIFWIQIADAAIGSITGLWDIVDFVFTGNRYSAKIFSKHIEKLKKEALNKWIPKDQIDKIWQHEKRFTKFINAIKNRGKFPKK